MDSEVAPPVLQIGFTPPGVGSMWTLSTSSTDEEAEIEAQSNASARSTGWRSSERPTKPMKTSSDCCKTNQRAIAELEQNENARVSRRVKDEERWHVAAFDEAGSRVILVRGSRGWAPALRDIDGPAVEQPLRVVFPDQEHRDKVEAASMEYVAKHYKDRGFSVRNVSAENFGYDLEVVDEAGGVVQHVEVKGTSLATQGFYLTRNELNSAQARSTWRLAIVTSALTRPSLEVLTARQMQDRFAFEPLVWRCNLLGPSAGAS